MSPWMPDSHAQRQRTRLGRTLLGKQYERKRRADPELRNAHRLRNTPHWRKLRKLKLVRNPLCEECQRHGAIVPATQVHHVVQLATRPDLAYDTDNLAALCSMCHALESARERRAT
jgi:5-methylcytosine-specific restriction endonuclease McrA